MKKKKQINYKIFFYTGVIWVGTGVVFLSSVNKVLGISFIGLGITFMVISAKNKDKWNKK